MKKLLLSIKNLEKNYKNLCVFKDLNFNIYEGDKIALLGVNGSGKSTLIEIILKLQKPTSGNVVYYNNVQNDWHATFQIGFYTKNTNVKMLIDFYLLFYPNAKNDLYVQKLLELLEIQYVLYYKFNTLSFGEKKKVELILSLISNSDFLFFDEITAGTDINARKNIVKIFEQIFKNNIKKTMIWITHDMNEIKTLCNRIIILSKVNKKIIFNGTLKEVKTKFKSVDLMIKKYLSDEIDETSKIKELSNL